jgi:signal transduction histidine kinase/ligand-binding sensor domain-containing protein
LSASNTCRSGGAWRAWVVPAALLLALGAGAAAQEEERATSQYLHDRWQSDRGFPGGQVFAITQSTDGYLWIGAEKGLVRFDGLRFRLFEPRGTLANSGPTVLGLAASPDGSVWARLRGAGLVRYRAGRFETMRSPALSPETIVSAMVRGRDDSLIVATLGFGIVGYRNERFDLVVPQKAIPSPSFVISIAQTSSGERWFGTRDAGLLRGHQSQLVQVTGGLPDLKVNCLLDMPDGGLWIGTDKGIVRWDGRQITREGIPGALQALPALMMLRDTGGNIWIAAGTKGLLRVDREGRVSGAGRGPGLRVNAATLFEDREGNVWVGTDRGIERWHAPAFTSYSTAQGLPGDDIGPLFVDHAGRTWFAPTPGGLYWLEDGVVHRVAGGGFDRDVVYSIAGDATGIWVGRQRGGLSRLRREGGQFTVDQLTRADGLAQDSVYAVHRAKDGTIWAGTLSAGASRYKDGVFTNYDTRHGLASNTVSSILDGRDGTVWFATPGGVSALSPGGWRTYTTADGLPANDANALFEDSQASLWIGTVAGLAVIERGAVRRSTPLPPPLRAAILGIAEDGAGALWFSTPAGVVRADRRELLSAGEVPSLRVYGVRDGLLAAEGVKRHRSVVADAGHRIWFSLARGLSHTDASLAGERSLPALTHIAGVTADGAAVDMAGPVRIPSSRRRIAIEYTGVALSVPERVMYRYRLDGFDSEWSQPVAERQAVYTNLTPGPYRFRVTASNSDGLWNGDEATFAFDVQPMVWQAAWFRALLVLIAAAAAWGLYRLRMIQMARRLNQRFEARLDERTRIARDLHDTLLQGFISASMQLHVAMERLPEDSPVKPSLGQVASLMKGVIDEGRTAVSGLRSPTPAVDNLESAFTHIQREIGTGPADFRVIVEGRPRPLNGVVRDEVYRIGREGLINAFRHSQASAVEVELEYRPRELRLFVRDDGVGIPQEVVREGSEGHWGLTGMHERARRIGGSLAMRTRQGAGTEIELRIPGRVAFARDTHDRRGAPPDAAAHRD